MVKKKNPVTRVLIYVLLIGLTVITLTPLIWMISSSLKIDSEVFTVPIKWIPDDPQWSNYTKVWEKIPLLTFTWNSIKLTVLITIIQVITSSFAAYGFAKCKFKGRNLLFLLYVATMSIPWQVYMLPQYSLMNTFGLIDTHLGYILMQSFNAFGVFLMRQAFISIPDELLEAARIDGLSEYGIYARIMLPLSKASITTLVIFTFVTIWNDYMGPMIYFNTETNKTIQLGIRMFIGQYSTEYGLVMAVSVLALLPVLIIFLVGQICFLRVHFENPAEFELTLIFWHYMHMQVADGIGIRAVIYLGRGESLVDGFAYPGYITHKGVSLLVAELLEIYAMLVVNDIATAGMALFFEQEKLGYFEVAYFYHQFVQQRSFLRVQAVDDIQHERNGNRKFRFELRRRRNEL